MFEEFLQLDRSTAEIKEWIVEKFLELHELKETNKPDSDGLEKEIGKACRFIGAMSLVEQGVSVDHAISIMERKVDIDMAVENGELVKLEFKFDEDEWKRFEM